MGSAPPFRQFVVKVVTRCDLACDHCYVYEAADTSWRRKPRFMTEVSCGVLLSGSLSMLLRIGFLLSRWCCTAASRFC